MQTPMFLQQFFQALCFHVRKFKQWQSKQSKEEVGQKSKMIESFSITNNYDMNEIKAKDDIRTCVNIYAHLYVHIKCALVKIKMKIWKIKEWYILFNRRG